MAADRELTSALNDMKLTPEQEEAKKTETPEPCDGLLLIIYRKGSLWYAAVYAVHPQLVRIGLGLKTDSGREFMESVEGRLRAGGIRLPRCASVGQGSIDQEATDWLASHSIEIITDDYCSYLLERIRRVDQTKPYNKWDFLNMSRY